MNKLPGLVHAFLRLGAGSCTQAACGVAILGESQKRAQTSNILLFRYQVVFDYCFCGLKTPAPSASKTTKGYGEFCPLHPKPIRALKGLLQQPQLGKARDLLDLPRGAKTKHTAVPFQHITRVLHPFVLSQNRVCPNQPFSETISWKSGKLQPNNYLTKPTISWKSGDIRQIPKKRPSCLGQLRASFFCHGALGKDSRPAAGRTWRFSARVRARALKWGAGSGIETRGCPKSSFIWLFLVLLLASLAACLKLWEPGNPNCGEARDDFPFSHVQEPEVQISGSHQSRATKGHSWHSGRATQTHWKCRAPFQIAWRRLALALPFVSAA